MDLQAEPEPCLAILDKSEIETPNSSNLYNFDRVAIKADKPDAEEANPAAVGKLFSDAI